MFTDENQKKKSLKAKKSPLSFFKKSKREASPHPAPTGKLFGRPLADVCHDNDIPKSLYVSVCVCVCVTCECTKHVCAFVVLMDRVIGPVSVLPT